MPLPQTFSLLVLGQGLTGIDVVTWALDAGSARVSSSDEKTVATHMGNLRAKLKSSGTDGYLETVWGIGFKLRRP